jgi:hypothetical protein
MHLKGLELDLISDPCDLRLVLEDQVVPVDQLLRLREEAVVEKGFLGEGLPVDREFRLE